MLAAVMSPGDWSCPEVSRLSRFEQRLMPVVEGLDDLVSGHTPPDVNWSRIILLGVGRKHATSK